MKYEQLGVNSLMEGLKLNGFSIKKDNDPTSKRIYFSSKENIELNEEIELEFEDKGGIIVFSTNDNVIELSKNKLLNIIKNKIQTKIINFEVYKAMK